jgi:hypothetical protein
MHIGFSKRRISTVAALMLFACPWVAGAGQAGEPVARRQGPATGVVVDAIVAVVNGRPILKSEVEQEAWFERLNAFETGRAKLREATAPLTAADREESINHLINQQIVEENAGPSLTAQPHVVSEQWEAMTRQAGGAAELQRRLSLFHLAPADARAILSRQTAIVEFLDGRFGAQRSEIPDSDVERYYHDTLVPKAKAKGITPEPLNAVAPKIRELLRIEYTTKLETQWIKTLRAKAAIQLR